ncbi:hypothetical protein Tco_0223838 [Tanacetum coccineum]
MDNLNITMEEYIRLEEEKDQKRGKVFNWETAKYGKIWYDEDIHDLRSVETKFPAITFNDDVLSEKTLSCEPMVSSLNDEIDFSISFDDSDDEDDTVIFDKNSFSYKIISTNDLKTDSENDNEKVNLPSLPSPEPAISCFDDLDFFKDFENEFPAIVYNNAQTSKSALLTESILSPQRIDEFDLNDKTLLSEYDEDEKNVLYFTDLFPFNIIHLDDLKSEKDNDDNEIDIIQSSRVKIMIWNYYGMLFYLIMNLYVSFGIPFDPKRYYKDGVYTRMLQRPRREVHRVQVFDFGGLSDLMDDGLSARMLMEHRDAQGGLMVIAPTLPVIDMAELVRLQIYVEIDDTWAWVALGEERHPDATAGTPGAVEDAFVDDERGQAVLAPVQAPQPPPPLTCGEINDRSGEILYMDDFMYGTADEG